MCVFFFEKTLDSLTINFVSIAHDGFQIANAFCLEGPINAQLLFFHISTKIELFFLPLELPSPSNKLITFLDAHT